jgi:hypothetical protein
LLLFVDAVAAKQIIAPVLNSLVGDLKKVFEASHAQTHEALRTLVKRAIKSGDIRKDLDPIDLIRAIVGVANVSAGPGWKQSARRLVDILILGARPLKSTSTSQPLFLTPLLHQRRSPLADLLKRRFEAAKLLRTQFRKHSPHQPGMLSERRNDEVLAHASERDDANTPVFGALDPADQAFAFSRRTCR